jgi:alkanesulfonate monooxygenase SsuD/methylene tetrahydromethanopterin reductase-like flavin-dependent oxidoreductase (luciferase family)
MIDIARTPGQAGGSHVLAWADRPEARTEAALYGTPPEVAAKLAALRQAGVVYVLANILGQSRETLRQFAQIAGVPHQAGGGGGGG